VKDFDFSDAGAVEGVEAIITHHDVPRNKVGVFPDQEILAENIRYEGQPIAAVAAINEDAALKAVRLIKVDIDEEEPVFDPLEAMKPDAPKVRPEGNLYMFDGRPYRKVVFGDIEAGFKAADLIVEGKYRHPCHEHAPMETHVSISVPEANGKLTIYSVAQGLMRNLRMVASVLGMESGAVKQVNDWSARVRTNWRNGLSAGEINFVGGVVGGAFGGKNDPQLDCITALLALNTGQPVKWQWTREEETLYSTYRGPWYMKYKDGVKKDGRIIARQVTSIRDAGAYTNLGPYVVDKHCFLCSGPYFIPNVHVKGYLVYTNKVASDAMRGFGITPSSFATELQMNKIAEKLGMDPWELRFINAYRNGDKTATRVVLDSVHVIECMKAVAKMAGVELPERLMAMSSNKQGDTV
jgi:CO/xanthine dehydrogenase Mo-binding subunit